MSPDFTKNTIDTLAKRAAFKCSNPDCRACTVGPNSEAQKSTLIGEAAHIFGARPNSKRYSPNMTNAARAEITNSIWLCRNCHKLIDTDEEKFTSNIIFAWREKHESHIMSELGNATSQIQLEEQNEKLQLFENCPPIIRRIVVDRPDGWEWQLTAELMRYLNTPFFKKLEDLHDGLYIKEQKHVDEKDVIRWVQMRITESSNLTEPMVKLIDRLNKNWGTPGQPGNAKEIYHTTRLIQDHLKQIILHEEQLCFVNVSDKFKGLINLLKNLLSYQAKKLEEIPVGLDEIISLIGTNHGGTTETPHIIKKTIIFDVPDGWEKKMNFELKRIKKSYK